MNFEEQKVYNRTRLRNLKRAKLKQKEAELTLYTQKGYDEKTIHTIMKDIHNLKKEISSLNNN